VIYTYTERTIGMVDWLGIDDAVHYFFFVFCDFCAFGTRVWLRYLFRLGTCFIPRPNSTVYIYLLVAKFGDVP